MDAVDLALAAVDRDAFVAEGDGDLPQSSSTAVIARVLRALDIHRGMRVLEVGTGSGFSTALLCHLVGRAGAVLSVEIDPALVRRAAGRLSRAGLDQAQVVAADARDLPAPPVPHDRLVAWATADVLPATWVEAVQRGRIVAPVRLLALEGAAPVMCATVEGGVPTVEGFLPCGFIALTATPVLDFEALRTQGADAVAEGAALRVMLSAPWARDATADVRERLQACAGALVPSQSPLAAEESAQDLWWYLVATDPEGLTSATLLPGGPAFGCADATGLVLLSRGGDSGSFFLVAGRSAPALGRLADWIRRWRAAGRPGLAQLGGAMALVPGEGWRVRAVVAHR